MWLVTRIYNGKNIEAEQFDLFINAKQSYEDWIFEYKHIGVLTNVQVVLSEANKFEVINNQ
ncbi:hypothetical protein PU629_07305 [Pullulanibacillus sp. KACC 23026]|uniref:hypothetical protein n=1 Tax=Pullulanibacillus sp. KACC 23026 TaxID=3028315 RepID=UPI0023AE7064|nr:hypothetical protein [Pullulanibacillus sp. KACC 23026]WEG14164.1 hypothetical protein PU629_07305 [Pullulanibacillus sp. KACC 23026]